MTHGSNSPEDTHNTSESPMDNSPQASCIDRYVHTNSIEGLKINLVPSYAYTRKYYRNGYILVHHDRVHVKLVLQCHSCLRQMVVIHGLYGLTTEKTFCSGLESRTMSQDLTQTQGYLKWL